MTVREPAEIPVSAQVGLISVGLAGDGVSFPRWDEPLGAALWVQVHTIVCID